MCWQSQINGLSFFFRLVIVPERLYRGILCAYIYHICMYLEYFNLSPPKIIISVFHLTQDFMMSLCFIITFEVAGGLQLTLQSPAANSATSRDSAMKLAVVMVVTGPAEDLLSAANRCMLPPGVNQAA